MNATIKQRMNKRVVIYDTLAALLICAVIALGIWRAPHVFMRTVEAVRDVFCSLAYLFFLPVEPTSTTFSLGMIETFPRVWAEFTAGLQTVGTQLISSANFSNYLFFLAFALQDLVYIFTFLALGALIFYLCVKRSLKKYNHDWNVQSRPLRIFLGFYERRYRKARNFVRGFVRHIKQRGAYRVTLILLGLFFLNTFTIVLEFIAWYFYFIAEFNMIDLGVQVIKLSWDLLLMISTLPWWAWLYVTLKILNAWRKEKGFRRLEAHEEHFREFAERRSIVSLIVAAMRKGKTTLLAALQRVCAKILRKKAKKGMREIDLKFPDFPWIVLEKSLQRAFRAHEVFTLYSVRQWANNICALHEKYKDDPQAVRKISEHFSHKYGVPWQGAVEVWDKVPRKRRRKKRQRSSQRKTRLRTGMRPEIRRSILFGYDTKLFPTTYNGGLGVETIYDAIHDYAQLYLIYLTPTLHIGNLPVRMNDDLEDRGNEISWDDDFYRKEPSPVKNSRLSHIIDYDMFRPGRRKNPRGKYRNAFEFGVVGITEIGKERGNQHDQKGLKSDAPESNILNDLFNQDLKMRGHCATVHHFPFIRIVSDEQRSSSVNADLKELCDVINITDSSKPKIIMPLFAIGEAVYELSEATLGKIFDTKMYNRGDQTLSLWILHNVIQKKIFNHYDRINNVYGGYKLKLVIASGPEDLRSIEKETVFISTRRDYSNVFPTDSWRGVWDERASRSEVGLSDVPCFKDVNPTNEEYEQMHSHAYDKWQLQLKEEEIIARVLEEATREAAKQLTEAETPDTAKKSAGGKNPSTTENNPNE